MTSTKEATNHTGERGKQHVAAARAGQGKLFE